MGEKAAGATHSALHLVKEKQQAKLIRRRAQALEIVLRRGPDAAFALYRLYQDGRRFLADGRPQGVEVGEGNMVEAVHDGSEALRVFFLPPGGDIGQGAPVKGVFGAYDPKPFGVAGAMMVSARHLYSRLHGFAAGITEECRIGEAVGRQPFGKSLLIRNRVKIGAMPQLASLFLQGFDNMGMGVAETGDADSTGEIQESPVVRGKKIGPFPALESQIRRVIRGQDGGNHVTLSRKK